jgi:hypothetical protein
MLKRKQAVKLISKLLLSKKHQLKPMLPSSLQKLRLLRTQRKHKLIYK